MSKSGLTWKRRFSKRIFDTFLALLIGANAFAVPPSTQLDSWKGKYVGMCNGGIQMELDIGARNLDDPEQRIPYTIIYKYSGKTEVRAYELIPMRAEAGKFILDEKNGIKIDTFLDGNTLRSQFTVGDRRLTSRCELRGGIIAFEIVSFAADTGGSMSAPLVASQVCTLTRFR